MRIGRVVAQSGHFVFVVLVWLALAADQSVDLHHSSRLMGLKYTWTRFVSGRPSQRELSL